MVNERERVSLAQLLAAGVEIGCDEAVAIVRELCTVPRADEPATASAPLTPGRVWLDSEGRLTVSPGVPMTVAHLGGLLEVLLLGTGRPRQGRLPGPLVLTLARAIGQLDAPGFATPLAFSESLARFERAPRREALRSLFGKWIVGDAASAPLITAPTPPRRRRHRHLRKAWIAGIAAGSMAAGAAAAFITFQRPEREVTPASAPSVTSVADRAAQPAPPAPKSEQRPAEKTVDLASTPGRYPGNPGQPRNPQQLVDSKAIQARAVFSPSFASNGTALFFHAQGPDGSALKRAEKGEGDNSLHVATIVDDGAKNYHVQLSPDGRWVAFDSDREGERGVYTARADGAGVTRVSGDGYSSVPKWSPDSRQLIFARAEPDRPQVWNLWSLDLNSGVRQRLSSHPFGQTWPGAWFGDGHRVCYSHEDRLVVLDLTTGQRSIYQSPLRGRLVRTPAVSPNGRWVMFQVFRDGGWLLDLSDGSMVRVLDDASAEEFTWSPDGRRVAFHSRRSGRWGLWVMSPR